MYDDSEPKGGVVSSASIGAPQIGERADLGTGLDSQHGKERTDSLKANPAPSPFLKIKPTSHNFSPASGNVATPEAVPAQSSEVVSAVEQPRSEALHTRTGEMSYSIAQSHAAAFVSDARTQCDDLLLEADAPHRAVQLANPAAAPPQIGTEFATQQRHKDMPSAVVGATGHAVDSNASANRSEEPAAGLPAVAHQSTMQADSAPSRSRAAVEPLEPPAVRPPLYSTLPPSAGPRSIPAMRSPLLGTGDSNRPAVTLPRLPPALAPISSEDSVTRQDVSTRAGQITSDIQVDSRVTSEESAAVPSGSSGPSVATAASGFGADAFAATEAAEAAAAEAAAAALAASMPAPTRFVRRGREVWGGGAGDDGESAAGESALSSAGLGLDGSPNSAPWEDAQHGE